MKKSKKIPKDTEWKCSVCQKIFKKKNHLQVHEQRIHGEKKFQCPHCPKTFAISFDLKTHVKVVHEHPIKCSECNFGCGLDLDPAPMHPLVSPVALYIMVPSQNALHSKHIKA